MQSQVDLIERKDVKIATLYGKYEMAKVLLAAQGISSSILSMRLSISGANKNSHSVGRGSRILPMVVVVPINS